MEDTTRSDCSQPTGPFMTQSVTMYSPDVERRKEKTTVEALAEDMKGDTGEWLPKGEEE